jgi:hypothetical protein
VCTCARAPALTFIIFSMEGMEGMEEQAAMRFFGSIPFIHTLEVWKVSVFDALVAAGQWSDLLGELADSRHLGRGRKRLHPVKKQTGKPPAAVPLSFELRWARLQRSATDALKESAGRVDTAPRLPGVYALIHEDQIVYVGQSRNVASRLAQHGAKGFRNAAVLPVEMQRLLAVERLLLDLLAPPLNRDFRTRRIRAWRFSSGRLE